MLGDVARWLRILGEDCVYALPTWDDDEVLARVRADGRVLVSRDTRLVARAHRAALGAIEVPQVETEGVLLRVYGALGLVPDEARLASRCAQCNGALEVTDAKGAAARARRHDKASPLPGVAERHDVFWSCLDCGQPYWRGTHWDNIEGIRARLVAALDAA